MSAADAIKSGLRNALADPHAVSRPIGPGHAIDYMRLARRFGRVAGWYVPGFMLILGWPLMSAAMIQKSNTGYYWRPAPKPTATKSR